VATAEATTSQSQTLDVGDVWEIGVVTLDDDGTPVAATVAVTITTPAGGTATPTAEEEDDTGYYLAEYTTLAAGRHLAVVTVSGTVVGVVPFTAWAQSGTTAAGMPTLSTVKAYLGDTSWSDAEITDALNAETAAQRARCRVPAVYTDDLAQALQRRVARNLAARAVPVATFTSFEGGTTSARVPQLDAEITRFEAPYRRRSFG
jgi:hypothetical protein